jgi:hypothetical protein
MSRISLGFFDREASVVVGRHEFSRRPTLLRWRVAGENELLCGRQAADWPCLDMPLWTAASGLT